jgi:hypothetical protein
MKPCILKLSFGAAALFAAATICAWAQPASTVRIHVPFSYAVAGKILPPGDYVIQETGGMGLLLIQGRGRGDVAAVLTTSGAPSSSDREAGARFEDDGGEKRLTEVQLNGSPTRIVTSKNAR